MAPRYMLEVNVDDVIIEENALYVNRSHNEYDNLIEKVFNNEEETYNFYNEYAIGTAGFLSSQPNESTNNVLRDVANKTTSLKEFVKSFKEIVKRWHSFKAQEDFHYQAKWCKNARNRWLEEGTHNASMDGKNDDYEMVYRNNMMRNAYNIILKSQGNVKAREIVQDGLKKIDKDIENELAKLSISLDGQEMENEMDDGQNVEKTLDVNPILNPLVQ
ncbi:unnamed protein product [Dovyalis caffra]|uniref:Uncharacterized protein n=1 Tax=Dovyalis caffra TaxID=77055 RepID=A0AAV1RX49_9ROSI|nr:unnamed protein product [Dovyalis caffra]